MTLQTVNEATGLLAAMPQRPNTMQVYNRWNERAMAYNADINAYHT